MKLPAFRLLFDSPSEVLPPAGGNVPAAVVVVDDPKPGRVTCEGCGCALDTKGLIIRRGDGLAKYLGQADTIAALEKDLDTARQQVSELSVELAELKKPKRGIRLI